MNILLLAVSVAAALAVPALAQQQAPAQAEAPDAGADSAMAAVDAAGKAGAEGKLDQVPVEFARALVAMPYGPEHLPAISNPTAEQVKQILEAKKAYWTRVQTAIAAELAKTPDDEPMDEAVSYVGPNAARKMALSHHLINCNRILADIAEDEKVDASTPGQSIIGRKEALAQELAPRRGRVTDSGRGPCP